MHLCNSAGTLLHPDLHHDLVRVGIALYRVGAGARHRGGLPLRAALSWRSQLGLVKRLRAGDSVSYGRRWTADRPTTVGTVPAGYADGVPRALTNRGAVVHGGRRVPIVGTVCMDAICVDLGDAEAAVGDDVWLIGPHDTAERVRRGGLGSSPRHDHLRGHDPHRPSRPKDLPPMTLGIPGVRVGCSTHELGHTGVTVVIPPPGTLGAMAVRGGGPRPRESSILSAGGSALECHAVVLSGGSAFGLASADGVVAWCEEHGIGLERVVARIRSSAPRSCSTCAGRASRPDATPATRRRRR